MPYTDSRLRAGQLRHRVELVKPYGPAQDSTGCMALTAMSPVATVWAKIESITGRDVLAANQFSSIATHKITIRYRGNTQAPPLTITAQDQVWFRGRVFQIDAGSNPDESTKVQY